MKVIFVDNLLIKRQNEQDRIDLQPHLGLISLIAVLENAGHTCRLYDPKIDMSDGSFPIDKTLYKNIATKILSMDPDAVGLSSLGCNFICTVKIAGYLKAVRPALPVLLGGPHATVLHEQIMLSFPQIDVIVRNEAESKIIAVIDGLTTGALGHIPGVSWRRNDEVICNPGDSSIEDLDDLPRPAYHAYPIENLHLSSLRVEAGRGCPFRCTFCSTATFFGRRYRLKSAVLLCKELDFLHDKYGIADFGLTHDLFTVNRNKVLEFCGEVKKRSFKWSCSARMDCVDEELLKQMKDAGCRGIYYGIETGSKRMQEISKKKLDLDIFHTTLDYTLATGMRPTVSFITGYPEETKADQDDTLDLIGTCYLKKTSIDITIQLHLLTPEPGTALMQQYHNQLAFDNYITDFNFPTLEEDDAAMMENLPAIFMNHHYFTSVLPRHQHIFVTSFFEVLQALSPHVIGCLLRKFANSLHIFSDTVHNWMKEHYPTNYICTVPLFTEFIEATFKQNSYLCSLVKYMYYLQTLRSAPPAMDTKNNVARQKLKKKVALSPNISLFRNIHNAPGILEKLKQYESINTGLASKKTNIVVQLESDIIGQKSVRNYEVDNNLSDLLEKIKTGEYSGGNGPAIKYLEKAGFIYYC